MTFFYFMTFIGNKRVCSKTIAEKFVLIFESKLRDAYKRIYSDLFI